MKKEINKSMKEEKEKKEIDEIIERLKKEGKVKEAEYLSITKSDIQYHPRQRVRSTKKRELTKSDLVGAIIGFSIAVVIFSLSNLGFIPAFLIAMACYWIVKTCYEIIAEKVANKKK